MADVSDLETSPLFILMTIEIYLIYRKHIGYIFSVILLLCSKMFFISTSLALYAHIVKYIYFFDTFYDESTFQMFVFFFILSCVALNTLIAIQYLHLKYLGYDISDIIRVLFTYIIISCFYVLHHGHDALKIIKI